MSIGFMYQIRCVELQNDRGCPAAVLRIWMSPESDDAPQEICGEKSANTFPSEGSSGTVRISFTTTDKTIGAQVRVT